MIYSQDNTLNPTLNGTLFKGVTRYTCKLSVGAYFGIPCPFHRDLRVPPDTQNFLKTKFPPQLRHS